MSRTALVLGITGNLGRAAAAALARNGWRVRAMHRDPERVRPQLANLQGVELEEGDAMDTGSVAYAATDTELIVHAVNPPGYRRWREVAIPMLESTIAAARYARARILFPGNVYNYGPDAWPLAAEDAPHNPVSRKGEVRAEMERMLEDAAGDGARCIVIRAGDFFGGRGGETWFSRVLVRPGRPVRAVTYPGDHAAGHTWAYLPDLAETFARVAEREAELPAFHTLHFRGHYVEPGVEMAHAILRAAGATETRVKAMPWWALKLVAPVNETYRELLEMRYLWDNSLALDNARLTALLGEEPHTPLEIAVRDALRDLRCLGDVPAGSGNAASR